MLQGIHEKKFIKKCQIGNISNDPIYQIPHPGKPGNDQRSNIHVGRYH